MKEQSLEELAGTLASLTGNTVEAKRSLESIDVYLGNDKGTVIVAIEPDMSQKREVGCYRAIFFVSPEKHDLERLHEYVSNQRIFTVNYQYGKKEEQEEEEEEEEEL
jgi:hypothetical protein